MLRQGNLRGSKTQFSDGSEGYILWYPEGPEGDPLEEEGPCIDIDLADLDDAIALLQALKDAETEVEPNEPFVREEDIVIDDDNALTAGPD